MANVDPLDAIPVLDGHPDGPVVRGRAGTRSGRSGRRRAASGGGALGTAFDRYNPTFAALHRAGIVTFEEVAQRGRFDLLGVEWVGENTLACLGQCP